jgi:hypothetical protein
LLNHDLIAANLFYGHDLYGAVPLEFELLIEIRLAHSYVSFTVSLLDTPLLKRRGFLLHRTDLPSVRKAEATFSTSV